MEHQIGEFSRLTRISVKTLRFYHEEGVLAPSRIDEATGYRYYDEGAANRAFAVARLRELGFPLGTIKEIFAHCAEDEDIVPFLERRGEEIARSIEELRASASTIEEFLERQKEIFDVNLDKHIVIKELPELTVASIRYKGKYNEVGKYIGMVMKLAGRFAASGPFVLYHDSEYREEGADIEVCLPLRKRIANTDVTCRVLTGGRAVTLVHQGPYDSLSDSYRKIAAFMAECDFKAAVPSREVYIKGPGMIFAGHPKKYLTEIQVLVVKA